MTRGVATRFPQDPPPVVAFPAQLSANPSGWRSVPARTVFQADSPFADRANKT